MTSLGGIFEQFKHERQGLLVANFIAPVNQKTIRLPRIFDYSKIHGKKLLTHSRLMKQY